MTNLIEKTLLIGFGIFITSLFLTFSIPFFGHIFNYYGIIEDDLNDYLNKNNILS